MLKHLYGAISQLTDSFQGLVRLWNLLREMSFGEVLVAVMTLVKIKGYCMLSSPLHVFLIKPVMNPCHLLFPLFARKETETQKAPSLTSAIC